jgi:hypothetical protein
VAGLLVGGILLLAFIVRETRTPDPMIPMTLFRSIDFSSAVVTQFLMSGAIFSAAFLTSQSFQFGLGDSPIHRDHCFAVRQILVQAS